MSKLLKNRFLVLTNKFFNNETELLREKIE